MHLNKVLLMGRVTTAGPKLTYSEKLGGYPTCSFWLQVDEPGKDGAVFSSYIPVEITGKHAEDGGARTRRKAWPWGPHGPAADLQARWTTTRRERRRVMEKVIWTIGISASEQLQIMVREYEGCPYLDMRLFVLGEGGEWQPTRQGITISPELWATITAAVAQVNAELQTEESSGRRQAPRRPGRR